MNRISLDTSQQRYANFTVAAMGGWFAYEKEFEKAETNDKRGVIFTLHYESMKKVFKS